MATARFYAENILPMARVLKDQLTSGYKTIVALDASNF